MAGMENPPDVMNETGIVRDGDWESNPVEFREHHPEWPPTGNIHERCPLTRNGFVPGRFTRAVIPFGSRRKTRTPFAVLFHPDSIMPRGVATAPRTRSVPVKTGAKRISFHAGAVWRMPRSTIVKWTIGWALQAWQRLIPPGSAFQISSVVVSPRASMSPQRRSMQGITAAPWPDFKRLEDIMNEKRRRVPRKGVPSHGRQQMIPDERRVPAGKEPAQDREGVGVGGGVGDGFPRPRHPVVEAPGGRIPQPAEDGFFKTVCGIPAPGGVGAFAVEGEEPRRRPERHPVQ